jgi:hypothetical protein
MSTKIEEARLALHVAELEEEIVRLKAQSPKNRRKAALANLRVDGDVNAFFEAVDNLSNPDEELLRIKKNELRELRCVLRLGRPLDAVVADDDGVPILDADGNRQVIRIHNGYNIVDGQLVEKEG